ncbi:MAG: hypothetical protein ACOVQE_00470, partial [Chitinophagaceae bacterium]
LLFFSCLLLLSISFLYAQDSAAVPFTIAKRYFMRNDAQMVYNADGTVRDYIIIENKADLEKTFGYATVMGPNGRPTIIDFTKQFAIAIVNPTKENVTDITIKSLIKSNGELVLTYETATSNKESYKSNPFAIVIIDKKDGAPIKIIKASKEIPKLISASNPVPFLLAKNYFIKKANSNANVIINTKEDFYSFFGAAASMGENGKPTEINFSTQYVIALIEPSSTVSTSIDVKTIEIKGTDLTVNYEVKYGENLTYTANNFQIIVLDKKFSGKVKYNKMGAANNAAQTLKVMPIDVMGAPGQVTFSLNGKNLFYYSVTNKKGTINVNGKVYELTNYQFFNHNGTKQKFDGYTLSGNGITIKAPNVRPKTNNGEDCLYGTVPLVTITIKGATTTLKNVSVQDCPDY